MSKTKEKLDEIRQAVQSGSIASASKETLEEYSSALCHSQGFSHFGQHEYSQICETIRLHLLRKHINTLQDHITDLNRKNSITQYCVIALTATAIIIGAIQTNLAIRADKRAEAQAQQSVAQLQTPETKREPPKSSKH